MQDVFNYYAFISYKHEDEKYAKWLQKRLESYRLPSALQNEDVPKRAKPIFRDQTDLTPGQPLKDSIKDKLRLSKYLIVICSKNLAKESEYVNYEINSFVEMGRADRIIPVIIDGEPNAQDPENECFCSALKQIPGEILAANSAKDGRRTASLKVIAALFQLDADDLIKRDERRKLKNGLLIATASVLLSVLAIFALNTIFNLSFSYNLEEAITAYAEKDYIAAADFAVKALNVPGKKDGEQEAEAILRGSVISAELKNTNTQFHKDYELEFPNESVGLYGESKDGTKVAFSDLGKVWVYDFETGEKLATYDANTEKEALDEYLDPVNSTEDLIDNTVERKTESEKYTQELFAGDLHFYDKDGKIVCSFYAASTAKWLYSEDDSFVVIYSGESYGDVFIWSFEENVYVQLDKSYDRINEMYFSEMGGYLFIELGRDVDVYETVSGSYITSLTDDSNTGISSNFVFSDVHPGVAYSFSSSKATKHVFEDNKPDFSNAYVLTDYRFAVMPSNSKNYETYISPDGKRMHTETSLWFDHEWVNLLNISDVRSGETLFFIDADKNIVSLTPEFDVCISATEKDLVIYDTDTAKEIYTYHNYSPVTSVAINEDGSYAAYSIENGNIYILEKDGDTYSRKKLLFGSAFEGKTYISAMKGDRCVIYDEAGSYMYSIEADEKEEFLDLTVNDVMIYGNYYKNVVKSEKFFKGMFLELEAYAGEYKFLDYETGESCEYEHFLHPWNYFNEKNIFVGIVYTGQMQYGSTLKVLKFDKGEYTELYSLTPSSPAKEIYFDNTGEYIILVGDKGSEVIVAETGEVLFTVDREIRIHDGVIYDVSDDLVLPNKLPESEITSIKEFKKRAKELK